MKDNKGLDRTYWPNLAPPRPLLSESNSRIVASLKLVKKRIYIFTRFKIIKSSFKMF